jgi:hypothetical protein
MPIVAAREDQSPDSDILASMTEGMEALFQRPERGRGAYLSRLFAFFSEEVVRHWSACEQAPYRDVGRPVVWDEDRSRYHVLDFTLERRSDGARFVTEMKCEIEFEGYRYLSLTTVDQIEHHVRGAAFQKLLRLGGNPRSLRVTIGGAEQSVAGAILVWGIVTPEGRSAAMTHHGFADVLSVEDMLRDLGEWRPQLWADWVATRRRWTDELFEWLAYAPVGFRSRG